MLYEHTLVTQLPSDGWYEGSSRRSNGNLLITRADAGELYELDPEDPDSIPRIVYTFDDEDATGILNISAIPGKTDEFFVLTAYVDLAAVQIDNHCVWRLRMPSSSSATAKPQLEQIYKLPEGVAIVSVEAVSDSLVLFGDQLNDCIHLLDTRGAGGPSMTALVKGEGYFTPASAEDWFGINRIRVNNGYMWYTNSSRGVLGRVPVDTASGGFKVTGDVEIVTDGLEQTDGLAVSADAKTAYVCCMTDGSLVQIEISPAPTGSGKKVTASTKTVVEELINPTALLFTQAAKEDEEILTVVCSGAIEVRWIDSHSSMSWAGFADTINGSVSVSVETVVETLDMGENMATLRI